MRVCLPTLAGGYLASSRRCSRTLCATKWSGRAVAVPNTGIRVKQGLRVTNEHDTTPRFYVYLFAPVY